MSYSDDQLRDRERARLARSFTRIKKGFNVVSNEHKRTQTKSSEFNVAILINATLSISWLVNLIWNTEVSSITTLYIKTMAISHLFLVWNSTMDLTKKSLVVQCYLTHVANSKLQRWIWKKMLLCGRNIVLMIQNSCDSWMNSFHGLSWELFWITETRTKISRKWRPIGCLLESKIPWHFPKGKMAKCKQEVCKSLTEQCLETHG